MEIKHDNIIYVADISQLGGVETYAYEMVRKYKDKDIAVVYKNADELQLKRIRQYCRAYRHTDQKINCKVAIINWDTSIIDYITEKIWKENAKEGEGIYQTIHGDYEHSAYKWKPPTDNRIKAYIAITKHIEESFKRMTGNKNVIQLYNPLEVERQDKIIIVSATRLSPVKGKDRMIRFAHALDEAGIDYIWYVFTNDTDAIPSPNVIYMKPRLDVDYWIAHATYLFQASDTEGDSYSIKQALYHNVPVIVTPLPYLEEEGIKDGINAYVLKFDCSNINEIIKKIHKVPSFNFTKMKDNYNLIIADGKSTYEQERKKKFLVEATDKYKRCGISDIERTREVLSQKEIDNGEVYIPKLGEQWIVDFDRKEILVNNELVRVIDSI